MQHRFRFIATVAGLVVLCMASFATAAPRATLDQPEWLVPSDQAPAPGEINSFIYGTGWEPGEGYSTGTLDGQQGWATSGVNLPQASISSAAPCAGSQHLRLIDDTTVASGTLRGAFSPLQAPSSPNTIYLKIKISNDGGADYHLIAQSPAQTLVAWRIVFSYSDDTGTGPGTIYILDTGPAYVNTGVAWTQGSCKELRVDLDNAANEIRYTYDGALIHTGAIFAATQVEQVVLLTDCYQLTGETGDIDGISVQSLNEPPVAVQTKTWSQVKEMMR